MEKLPQPLQNLVKEAALVTVNGALAKEQDANKVESVLDQIARDTFEKDLKVLFLLRSMCEYAL